jgi:Peptidase family M23
MKRFLLVCLVVGFCWADASAQLDRLLQFQKVGDPGAFVSSGFHDWRTVSKYRRSPGLHFGYDIAMLARSPVRAAWPGEVVAITPWYGSEYGVTVRDGQGYEATYGHISPSVVLGQEVRVGDILGRVVVDHVDVKMRNSLGIFVDFAALSWKAAPLPLTIPDVPSLQKERERWDALLTLYNHKMRGFQHGLVAEKEWRDLEPELAALSRLLNTEFTPGSGSGDALTSAPSYGRKRTDQLVEALHPRAKIHPIPFVVLTPSGPTQP